MKDRFTWEAGEFTVTLPRKKEVGKKYSPDQPRGADGRFGDTGGGDVAGAVVAGATQGGFTVQPYRGTSPKTGYQVAINGHTEEFPSEILQDPVKLAAAIAAHLENNKSVYSKGGKLYIGGWVNTDSGKLVLEPSERISSRAEAISAGQDRNQISIWDNAKGEEIKTGGTGTG